MNSRLSVILTAFASIIVASAVNNFTNPNQIADSSDHGSTDPALSSNHAGMSELDQLYYIFQHQWMPTGGICDSLKSKANVVYLSNKSEGSKLALLSEYLQTGERRECIMGR